MSQMDMLDPFSLRGEQPETGLVNTLIKESAERMLPILGGQIQLCSFLASEVLPADVLPSEIQRIVSALFGYASERMKETGGVVFLRTENVTGPSAIDLDSAAESPSYVLLTFEQTSCHIEHDVTDPTENILRRLKGIVERPHWLINIGPHTDLKTQIRIYLPVLLT